MKYTISYMQTADGWMGSIYRIPGCHVEAPTIPEVRRLVGEALHLFFDSVEGIELEDEPLQEQVSVVSQSDSAQ